MEKTSNAREYEMPDDITPDYMNGFLKSEKVFQTTMLKIFEKYDRPFPDDIVVYFEDLTYDTPDDEKGRRPWNLKTYKWKNVRTDDIVSEEHGNETEDFEDTKMTLSKKTSSDSNCQDSSPVSKHVSCDSPEARPSQHPKKEKLSLTFDVDQFSSKTCTALMQHKEKNPDCDDRRRFLSSQNSDLIVTSRSIHVPLPFKATVSEQGKSLIDMSNKDCLLKSLRKYKVVNCQPNDSGPSNSDEASCSEPGNKTLEDFYPEMIEIFCKLWNLNIRIQATDKIVRYYKRHIFCKNKKINRNVPKPFNQTYTISFAPCVQEILTAPMTFYSSSASSSPCMMSISSTKSLTNNCQMDIGTVPLSYCKGSKHLQQNIHTLSRRCSSPEYFTLQSPKSNMSKGTMNQSKAVTSQTQMDIDERNYASYKEHTKLLSNRKCALTRRNSFSAFPIALSTSNNFESLYRNLTHVRPQPEFSLGKAQVQLSKTVSSLVNSPGSLRAKRPLSHDFLFSMSKKPRSATEAIVGSSKQYRSMDISDAPWSESSSLALQHSIVASSHPARMLPPNSASLRSFSPGVNDRSAERTNAQYSKNASRKLIYQDDGTDAGN